MKHLSRVIIAVFLAVLMATLLPVQVMADTPDYISEVKIFEGDYSAAEAESFTLLKDGNNPVDLNQNAGGGLGSKGEKAVYLGYKTTKDKNDAITDLALMNMKGGYSVKDYDYLMETQMKAQINGLVDDLLIAVNEYRENYDADVQRAVYIHDVLNKFIDDDTGKGLGDLLLNETKYEMGDKAYNDLSESDKSEHADIVTILAQSNGKATLMLENLITRAADTNDTSWLERFSDITYDDLIDATGKTPTDAKKELAKQYDDDANLILDMWDDFRQTLFDYDNAVARVENYDASNYDAALKAMDEVDDNTSAQEAGEVLDAFEKAQNEMLAIKADIKTIAIHDALDEIEYLDGTMFDFFTQEVSTFVDDITLLYPLVAALTEGQRVGLEFISLSEMLVVALTDEDGYSDAELDALQKLSIYDGVDRDIYKPGGVAITSDALRGKALANQEEESSMFSPWSIAMMAITGATFLALAGSAVAWGIYAKQVNTLTKTVNAELDYYRMAYEYPFPTRAKAGYNINTWQVEDVYRNNPEWKTQMESLTSKTRLCKGLTIGFGVALVVIAGITTYLTWQEMKEYYNVDFSAIPHYMIEEKDLFGYNKKGEKILLKNQSAYYKAVECNRPESAEFYNVLDTCADMNGDVGKQWLALYSVKKELMEPILADSLKVVVDSTEMPAGYETGIHMFGTEAAFNLNSSLYDWANDAPSVYVYFQTDDTAASTSGATFTGGSLAIAGSAGIVLGAAVTALAIYPKKKKNESA